MIGCVQLFHLEHECRSSEYIQLIIDLLVYGDKTFYTKVFALQFLNRKAV